jgi:BASS family bile acid:Na+ symporter
MMNARRREHTVVIRILVIRHYPNPLGSVADDRTIRVGERFARFVKRHFLWLLLGCYALAVVWPEPGLMMRRSEWSPEGFAAVRLSLPLLLLALMLFSAALLTDVVQIRLVLQQPGLLCLALAAVWLGPALLVVAAGSVVTWLVSGQATTGLLVGLALVAAMPVANSSVGWAQNSSGNLALGLALVVLSISLSPLVTPALLSGLAMSLSPEEKDYCEALVNQFSGLFFIVWVVLPTAAGLACGYLAGPERVARLGNGFTLASAGALLLLNYVNSALALPKAYHSPASLLAITGILAASLSVVGLALAWIIAGAFRQSTATRAALLFGLSMKHTGLALILADAVLADQPLAILMIVLATFLQHLLAGVAHWSLERRSSTVHGPVST